MHVPAKFRENTAMRFRVTVRKLLLKKYFCLQNSNITSISKNYTAHPHDMVRIPAKLRENTAMRFRVTVRKLNVMDGGRCNISLPGHNFYYICIGYRFPLSLST